MSQQAGAVVLEPITKPRVTRRAKPAPKRQSSTTILEALPTVLAEPAPAAHTDPARRPPSDEEIRLRAYQIYEARGRQPGHEVDDWLQAERELRARDE